MACESVMSDRHVVRVLGIPGSLRRPSSKRGIAYRSRSLRARRSRRVGIRVRTAPEYSSDVRVFLRFEENVMSRLNMCCVRRQPALHSSQAVRQFTRAAMDARSS